MAAKSGNQQQIENNNQEIQNNTNLVLKAMSLVNNLPSGQGGDGGSPDWDYSSIASKKQLGVVQVGNGISVTRDGVISVDGGCTIQVMTGEQISILPTTYSGTILCTETYNDIKSGAIYLITDREIIGPIVVDGGIDGCGADNKYFRNNFRFGTKCRCRSSFSIKIYIYKFISRKRNYEIVAYRCVKIIKNYCSRKE